MFSFASTSDKVLSIILENQDMPAQELISTIRSRLKLSQMEVESAFADLKNQGLISALYADGNICILKPQPYARSRLMTKREIKIFSLKWDLAKIALGFVSGFASAWLLK